MMENPQAVPPPSPAAYPPRRKSYWWVWLIVGLVALGCMALAPFMLIGALVGGIAGAAGAEGGTGPGVAVIRINGPITSGRSGGGLMSSAVAGSESIIDQINRALRDKNAKAIVLRINSPGGSAAGSEEVYAKVMSVRGRKPILVSMGDVAASGGYYIAAAADEIYCDGGTTTGSIGVIDSHVEVSGLMKKVGVTSENITTGPYKDMGTPTRALTDEEKAIIKAMIKDIYDQFVDAVAKGRDLPRREVLKIADGRVFSGRQAKALGLVDEIGGLEQALESAGRRVGLQPPIRKIELGPRGIFADLMAMQGGSDELTPMARRLLLQEAAKELAEGTLR